MNGEALKRIRELVDESVLVENLGPSLEIADLTPEQVANLMGAAYSEGYLRAQSEFEVR